MEILGIKHDSELLSPLTEDEIKALEYCELTPEEHDTEVLRQIKRIENDKVIVGTPARTQVWEDGWKENLDELVKTHSLSALMPRYFRKDQPFRLFRRFIHTNNYKFDFQIRSVIQRNYFAKYLSGYSDIYEFGCGTGINLIEVSKLYPDCRLHGLDLTKSSVAIMDILHRDFGINVTGKQFNFVTPDLNYILGDDAAVYTVAALEQIGDQWTNFLDYLLVQKPKIVLNLEPIFEFYDDNNLVDYCAMQFHNKRRYLSGYYTELCRLRECGKIEILEEHRTYVGNLNDESYSVVAWRPC